MASKDAHTQDPRDTLEQFGREAEQIIGTFVETLTMRKPPARICHYTNEAGLKGILKSGKLWLTEIHGGSLNDPSELDHGFKIGIKELGKMVVGRPPECQEFSKILTSVTDSRGIQESAHFFVCCFSSLRDDLGQWRAYTAKGTGFALEFDGAALEHGFTHNSQTAPNAEDHAVSFPITYNDAKIADLHRQIIGKMIHLISLPRARNLHPEEVIAYTRELALSLLLQLAHAALFFKHQAYKSEKEYRFLETYSVDVPPPDELIGPGSSMARHLEFDWRSIAPKSLKRVLVGPGADQEKAIQLAKNFLHRFNPEAKAVRVTPSTVPYRGC